MAAFSYQNHSFLLDSVYFPSPPTKSTVFMEKPEIDHESSCIVIDEGSGQMITQMEVSSMADNNNKKKRKKKNTEDGSSSSLESAQPKDEREKKKGRAVKKIGAEEAPTGYVHVRARRGQATDSHSLAERVRREKISKRMKILQGLVPGCDKVTGKALMLDEIINYVQSLQGQVEFLSMKLASLNPLYYDFGIDLDSFMASSSQRLNKLGSSLVQNGEQCSRAAENSFTTSNNCPLLETSTPFAFQQEEMANVLSQGNGELSWDVDIQIPKISGQTGIINNLCFPLM